MINFTCGTVSDQNGGLNTFFFCVFVDGWAHVTIYYPIRVKNYILWFIFALIWRVFDGECKNCILKISKKIFLHITYKQNTMNVHNSEKKVIVFNPMLHFEKLRARYDPYKLKNMLKYTTSHVLLPFLSRK